MSADIRKLLVCVDETRIEMGRPVEPPVRRAVAIAVIANPYAGRWSESLDALVAIGEELGATLGAACVKALGIAPGELCLVAAHHGDLAAARACGLMTAYVDRTDEYGGAPAPDAHHAQTWEWSATSLTELADMLGC